MSQPELLRRVIQALDDAGIDYMVTGSVVSSLQGEPRATHDIDIVIALQNSSVPRLLSHFRPPTYHLDEEDIHDALRSSPPMFNMLDVEAGDKVDFWLLTDDPFDRSRFNRRCEEKLLGMTVKISRPEDTILMKLRWAQLSGGSEKQFTDALRIYEVQHGNLDLAYLESWAERLSVVQLWNRLKEQAQPLE